MRMNQSLRDCCQSPFYCGTNLGRLIGFYSPLKSGDWGVDSLGFRFIMGSNFDDNPLLEPAFY